MEVEGGGEMGLLPINMSAYGVVPSSTVEAMTPNNRMMQVVRYRECLKNHAAAIGGNATDGCGEFMPSGEEGTLTCSVCNCHRNFHRKEVEGHHFAPSHHNRFGLLQGHRHRGTESINNRSGVLVPSTDPAPLIMSCLQSESDDGTGGLIISTHPHSYPQAHQMVKKRFRTKFTLEQKEKMLSFAEKVGWKIQRQEESVVQQFCQELGIKRRVLKVWMHNNKHNLAKNIPTNPPNQII